MRMLARINCDFIQHQARIQLHSTAVELNVPPLVLQCKHIPAQQGLLVLQSSAHIDQTHTKPECQLYQRDIPMMCGTRL